MAALRQIESQHEGFEKVNSRPLGKVRLETKRDVEAGHGGHAAPSYIGSGFAESLPEILPEHAADAVRCMTEIANAILFIFGVCFPQSF